jgi:hypothetical protein
MKPRDIGSASVANWSKSLAAIADVGGKFLHRELSQLAFNERVLAMATRDDVPLAERLRYICIVSSNLDEFFEVRLTDLTEEMREDRTGPAATSYRAILARAHRLVRRQYLLYNEQVMPALARRGVVILRNPDRNAAQREWVREYLQREVRPLLSPIGDWQTEGKGMVRIGKCGDALCGFVLGSSNEKGEAILINMKPKTERQWTGGVYSQDSGQTYYGTMSMKGINTLRVEACALGRFYCSGNNWSRITRRADSLVTSRHTSSELRS